MALAYAYPKIASPPKRLILRGRRVPTSMGEGMLLLGRELGQQTVMARRTADLDGRSESI